MTEESFRDHIKSLYVKTTDSKATRAVPQLTISWGKKSTSVRLSRPEKTLTMQEVESLSLEYGKDQTELIELFVSRKITITNDKGEVLHEYRKITKPRRKKGDAVSSKARGRKNKVQAELLINESPEHLPQEI
jgi:hypothetical protein